VGEHRVGFFMSEDVIMLARFLHRLEIFRYFP
jgi:hypothetical protein